MSLAGGYLIRKYLVTQTIGLSVLLFPITAARVVAADSQNLNQANIVVYSSDLGMNLNIAQKFTPNELLTLTNAARIEVGDAPLTLNDQLDQAAYAKAIDMAVHGYWDHFRPSDHKSPWDFIHEQGYDYQVAGENLARGFRTVQGITSAWLASPAHAANLLSKKYTDIGFASLNVTEPDGQSVLLTVQMFGSR